MITRRVTSTRRARAFTLLEAVIALIIISSVIVSVLSLRSQAIAQGQRLSERRFVERETESLFRMLIAGMLDQPTRNDTTSNVTWTGTHAGREYTITRQRETMPNPMSSEVAGEGRPVSPDDFRLEVHHRAGRTHERVLLARMTQTARTTRVDRRPGFTLLEVLLAVTVLGLITVLIAAMNAQLRDWARVERRGGRVRADPAGRRAHAGPVGRAGAGLGRVAARAMIWSPTRRTSPS